MVPILAFVMRGSKVGERSVAKSGPSLVIHRYTVVWCFPLGPLIIEFQQFREGERVRVEIKLLYVNAFDNFLFCSALRWPSLGSRLVGPIWSLNHFPVLLHLHQSVQKWSKIMGAKANLSTLANRIARGKTKGLRPSSEPLDRTYHESQYDNIASNSILLPISKAISKCLTNEAYMLLLDDFDSEWPCSEPLVSCFCLIKGYFIRVSRKLNGLHLSEHGQASQSNDILQSQAKFSPSCEVCESRCSNEKLGVPYRHASC